MAGFKEFIDWMHNQPLKVNVIVAGKIVDVVEVYHFTPANEDEDRVLGEMVLKCSDGQDITVHVLRDD